MPVATLLLDRLHAAGLRDVTAVETVEGGQAALAGIATQRNGPALFVKSFVDVPADDLFAAEAEGLDVLRERGGIATPEVILATHDVLVLPVLSQRPTGETFWELAAHALARLHTSTSHDRFGWDRDNWLGRYRQENTWTVERFFDVYAALTELDDDWRARMQLIQLRQHLAVIAQFDYDWGAAAQVRETIKPFRS